MNENKKTWKEYCNPKKAVGKTIKLNLFQPQLK
jgi:hypothetical protein